jgi:hypothetical protein
MGKLTIQCRLPAPKGQSGERNVFYFAIARNCGLSTEYGEPGAS